MLLNTINIKESIVIVKPASSLTAFGLTQYNQNKLRTLSMCRIWMYDSLLSYFLTYNFDLWLYDLSYERIKQRRDVPTLLVSPSFSCLSGHLALHCCHKWFGFMKLWREVSCHSKCRCVCVIYQTASWSSERRFCPLFPLPLQTTFANRSVWYTAYQLCKVKRIKCADSSRNYSPLRCHIYIYIFVHWRWRWQNMFTNSTQGCC